MKKRLGNVLCAVLAVAGLWLIMPESVHAYTVDIHGYGNQDFMSADKNQYLGAKGGTWEQHSMSLIFTAGVTDDTTVWARLHHDADTEATVDWLYVTKKLRPDVEVRVGQIKFPLGIYNLYAENKFLEISELEPMMYSPNVDHMIFDVLDGVDIEYSGTVGLELFGGANHVETNVLAKNVLGARIPWKTPIEGLNLIASGTLFTQETTSTASGLVSSQKLKLLVVSVDYVNHGLDLKAELAKKIMAGNDEMDKMSVLSYYVQAGYLVLDRWTPYVRYDILYADQHQKSDPSFYQKEATVGLAYLINSYLKVKAEEHFVNGYNVPVQSGEVAPGEGANHWHLFVTGVDFIF
ncbi:MAG TPA: hypothetical protein VLN91_07570 [Nitrospirota bacterium]|nr:hypothetical protein [Nitrospirota bacterium]